MVTVSLYYWAGAKAAAGVEVERFDAVTVADALDQARRRRSDPRFERVLSVSSVLIDGLIAQDADLDRTLTESVRVEILPPFAGGSGVLSGPQPTVEDRATDGEATSVIRITASRLTR